MATERYSKIYTYLWDDDAYRSLGTMEQLVYLYLFTSPHGNSAGIYRLLIDYAKGDMGQAYGDVKEAFATLCDRGLIAYDEAMHIVWIKDYLRHNGLTNPKHAKGAAKVSKDYAKSPLYSEFYKHIESLYPNYIEHFTEPIQRLSLGSETPKPINSLSEGYRNTETDTVTDTETDPLYDDEDDRVRVSDKDREELEAQCILTFGECSEHDMEGRMMSLVAWASIHGVKMVLNALIATHEQEGKKLNYTAKVLQDWKDRGYKTGDEYWEDELKSKAII